MTPDVRTKGKARQAATAGLVALTLAGAGYPSAASAQGFFDLLFGSIRRAFEPPQRYENPPAYEPEDRPRPSAPSVAYCVRLCDGRYFPINRAYGNTADACASFCPATNTKVFSGGSIDHSTSNDGTSYRDLPNAFAYRDKVVDGCTCNGKTPFGLAKIDVKGDPTLRPGDIVATHEGLMAATGRQGAAEFTPISGDARRRLSEVKVAPSFDSEAGDAIPGYDELKPASSSPAPTPAPVDKKPVREKPRPQPQAVR